MNVDIPSFNPLLMRPVPLKIFVYNPTRCSNSSSFSPKNRLSSIRSMAADLKDIYEHRHQVSQKIAKMPQHFKRRYYKWFQHSLHSSTRTIMGDPIPIGPYCSTPVWPTFKSSESAPIWLRSTMYTVNTLSLLAYYLLFNPLEYKGNYSVISKDIKLVHWPLMGWAVTFGTAGCDSAQSPSRCTKCRLTAHPSTTSVPMLYNGPLLCCINVDIKG